jgi:hypothetical protein
MANRLAQIKQNHTGVKYSQSQCIQQNKGEAMPTIRSLIEEALEAVKNYDKKTREVALAITKLEEALMWWDKV